MLTEGGRNPTGVNKLGRPPIPAVFGLGISIPAPPSECGWIAADNASSKPANPRKNKIANSCRIAPDRCGVCALPCHCAKASRVEAAYVYMKLPTKHVQRMDAVSPCRMGKLSAVVRLYLGRCIAKITDRTFHKVYGGIAALFLVGVYEAFP